MRRKKSQLNKAGRAACLKRLLACVLVAALLAGTVPFSEVATRINNDGAIMDALFDGVPTEVLAKKDPLFKLSQAKTIAVSKSDVLESLDIQVESKSAAMQSSVKSLREKERNMATIRWSPLLNIKFPTKPNEEEAFTFQFKPTQLQYQINIIKHRETEEKLKVYEDVSNTYIKIITAEQALKYDSDALTKLTATVERLKAQQIEGAVTQEKVDKAQEKLDDTEVKVANDKTQFERGKEKLSEKVGFDVTTGYRFEDAFVTADLSRDFIPLLQAKGIEKDQGVYEASVAEQEALLALRVNYSLMSNQYGGYMSLINTYVDQALAGEKISKKAFKKDYDEFLKKIDEKWQGHYKFLFIKIPKEWLKGDLDGIRYVEDDPYVLYTAALDYESARKELENTKKELRSAIADYYDNYAEARKSYINLNKQVIKANRNFSANQAKNLLGEYSDDELQSDEQDLESMRSELNSALSTYSSTLYEYDKMTCGAVSQYLKGSAAGDDREEGLSSIIQTGVTYTIRAIVQTEEFLLTLNVPDDFEAKTGMHITDFALYSDGRQIGERVSVGEAIRHLALTMEDVGKVTVRIYDGSTFLDECEIDPTVYIGDLKITTGYEEDGLKHVIGTYSVADNLSTDTVEITLKFSQDKVNEEYESGKDAAYYNIATAGGSFLRSEDKIEVGELFSYMSFIRGDIGDLVVHLYDENKEEIGTAVFNEATRQLIHDVTDDEAAEIEEAKQQQAEQEAIDAEEAERKRKEAERREKAEAVLEAFGFEKSEENITYVIAHLRELQYAADLQTSIRVLEEKYNETKAKLDSDAAKDLMPGEITALEKQMDIQATTRQKQQESLEAVPSLTELKQMNGQ